MTFGKILLLVAGGLVALIVGRVIAGISTRLDRLEQDTNAAWVEVRNVYQRRADLIPNLVNTVTGAANFEKSVRAEIVEARAAVERVQLPAGSAPADPAKFGEFERAQDQLSSAWSRLRVVAERHPDLKATTAFRDLRVEIEDAENRIRAKRTRFNETVQAYNTAIRSFPTVIFAGMFGHAPRPCFTATAGAARSPEVKLDSGHHALSGGRVCRAHPNS